MQTGYQPLLLIWYSTLLTCGNIHQLKIGKFKIPKGFGLEKNKQHLKWCTKIMRDKTKLGLNIIRSDGCN